MSASLPDDDPGEGNAVAGAFVAALIDVALAVLGVAVYLVLVAVTR